MYNTDTSDSWNDIGIEGKDLLKDERWSRLCRIGRSVDDVGRKDCECGREPEGEET